MSWNWPSEATIAAVLVAWACIWLLRKRGLNFSLATIGGLIIGVPIGLIAGNDVQAIDPIGEIYINILLATVAPLIFVAIISSITSLGSLAKLKSIGSRSVFWLMSSNGLGVGSALALALLFGTGHGVHDKLSSGVSTDAIAGQAESFSATVVNFFPVNVVQNFSANDIIPIILVAVTLSVAYLALAEQGTVKAEPFVVGIEAIKLVVFKAVGYIIRLVPYAVVALTAYQVGSSTDLGTEFTSLLGLLVLVWAACFLHTYVINAGILKAFARVPVVPFFRKIFPAQLTAFTTQSSVGTLPVTTARLTRQVGVNPEIAHFTAPLGTTIGMPGCAGIWPIMIGVWGIHAFGLHYTTGHYITLALLAMVVSVGTAGVPGAATVAAATVFVAAGLPLEFVAVTIPIGTIADMARTMTNVTAAAVSATVVARQTGLLDDEIFAGRAVFLDGDELSESELVPTATGPAGPIAIDAPPRRSPLGRLRPGPATGGLGSEA